MAAPKSIGSQLREFFEYKSGGVLRYLVEEIGAVSLNWIPGPLGHFLRWMFYRALVSGSGFWAMERGVEIFGTRWIRIGSGVYLGEGVMLQGRPGGLEIGDDVRIMPRAVLNVYNYRGLEGSGIEIGQGSVIGIGAVITGQGRVSIGEDVIIGPGAKLMPVNHNYADPGRPVKEQGIVARGIVIGRGAWLGAGAVILDGVEVGENAVIAAGAVVRDSVSARSLAAGNPAQVIRAI
jgi:acetyltransferase-like isoleucine patch superfamily enzyme